MFFISFLLLPGFSLCFSEQLSKVSITPFLHLSGDIPISQAMQVYICCCTSKRVEYSTICSYSNHLSGFKIIPIRFVSESLLIWFWCSCPSQISWSTSKNIWSLQQIQDIVLSCFHLGTSLSDWGFLLLTNSVILFNI